MSSLKRCSCRGKVVCMHAHRWLEELPLARPSGDHFLGDPPEDWVYGYREHVATGRAALYVGLGMFHSGIASMFNTLQEMKCVRTQGHEEPSKDSCPKIAHAKSVNKMPLSPVCQALWAMAVVSMCKMLSVIWRPSLHRVDASS